MTPHTALSMCSDRRRRRSMSDKYDDQYEALKLEHAVCQQMIKSSQVPGQGPHYCALSTRELPATSRSGSLARSVSESPSPLLALLGMP